MLGDGQAGIAGLLRHDLLDPTRTVVKDSHTAFQAM
jgi:hypothetical protein